MRLDRVGCIVAMHSRRLLICHQVFRAENANTHRHLTEFIGLDLEMAIEEHYHEVLELLDGLFLNIFRELREKFRTDIEIVRKQFPAEEFIWREGPEGTLKLSYAEAIELLVGDGVEIGPTDDIKCVIEQVPLLCFLILDTSADAPLPLFSTENEKRLGRIVRAKYQTDYFIIDKFPMELRPFYTMGDPNNPVNKLVACAVCLSADAECLRAWNSRACPTRTTSSCAARRSCQALNVSMSRNSSSRR